jgi:transcriptional regulator with XRE-family HTH domain
MPSVVPAQPPKPSERLESDALSQHLAARIRFERQKRGWSLQNLAEHSGVSRAMISKIERLEASPTATTLSRLGSAFGFSISELLSEETDPKTRLARRKDQQVWRDPETGYQRRSVSPSSGMPLQLIEVILPPKTHVSFPAIAYLHLHQQIWVRQGQLTFLEGSERHELNQGDCLQLAGAQDCVFKNSSNSKECRYVVALIVNGGRK